MRNFARLFGALALNVLGGWALTRLGARLVDRMVENWPMEPVVAMLNADLDPSRASLRIVK